MAGRRGRAPGRTGPRTLLCLLLWAAPLVLEEDGEQAEGNPVVGWVAVGEGCWANWLLRVAGASWGWPLCLDLPASARQRTSRMVTLLQTRKLRLKTQTQGFQTPSCLLTVPAQTRGDRTQVLLPPGPTATGPAGNPGASSAPPSPSRSQGVRASTGPGISASGTHPASQHLHCHGPGPGHHPCSLVSSSWPCPSSLPIRWPRKHRQMEMGPHLSWHPRTLPLPISHPYPPLAWRSEGLTPGTSLGCKPSHLGVTQMSLVLSSR